MAIVGIPHKTHISIIIFHVQCVKKLFNLKVYSNVLIAPNAKKRCKNTTFICRKSYGTAANGPDSYYVPLNVTGTFLTHAQRDNPSVRGIEEVNTITMVFGHLRFEFE